MTLNQQSNLSFKTGWQIMGTGRRELLILSPIEWLFRQSNNELFMRHLYLLYIAMYSIDVDHDNLCITGCIYFWKRVQELYSFSLVDIYFFVFNANKCSKALGEALFLHLNIRHKMKMFISYIYLTHQFL